MKLDGIEREVVIVNPYRKKEIVNSYSQSIQKNVLNTIDNKKNSLIQQNSDNIQKIKIPQEEFNKIIEEIRHKFSMLEKYLKIDIDEELKMTISKIIDMRTEEVIRQIPPEWLVNILRRMEELKGLFYYEEV